MFVFLLLRDRILRFLFCSREVDFSKDIDEEPDCKTQLHHQ